MQTQILALIVAAAAACHSQPPKQPAPLSAEQRVSASMARWGTALAHGDRMALATAEDKGGQIAIIYVATKYAATHVEGGKEAVEQTVFSIMLAAVLDALWPSGSGPSTWMAV